MSFIKIKDPRKREELIKDFIETRKRIKNNFVAQKVGEAEYQTGLTKLFKPVTETQKETAKEITEAQKTATKEITEAQKAAAERIEKGLLPIKEGIESLKMLEVGDPIPAIDYTEKEKTELGVLAVNALTKTHGRKATQSDIIPVDPAKSLYRINQTPITIINNDIYINDAKTPIEGTPGLWELLASQNIPDFKNIERADLNNYIIIMYMTKATYDKNNKRIGGNNNKMNNLIRPLVVALEKGGEEYNKEVNKRNYSFKDKYEEFEHPSDYEEKGKGKGKGRGRGKKKHQEDPKPGTSKGKGLKFLSSDPNALIDRFDLLFSSKKAGHTGVRNELISILDELKRQGVINVNEYKKLNSLIKK